MTTSKKNRMAMKSIKKMLHKKVVFERTLNLWTIMHCFPVGKYFRFNSF